MEIGNFDFMPKKMPTLKFLIGYQFMETLLQMVKCSILAPANMGLGKAF